MARLFGAAVAAMLFAASVANAQPRLNGPLFPPLPDEMIVAMSDALLGCDSDFKRLVGASETPDSKKTCSSPPVPIEQRRVLIEAGRITGLLEACGEAAPSQEVLPKAMAGVEALPGYGAETEYYGSALHGFALFATLLSPAKYARVTIQASVCTTSLWRVNI